LVVILAIVAVLIAKETVKRGEPALPTESPLKAQNPVAEDAPGAAARSGAASDEATEGPLSGSELAACLKSGRPTLADFGMGWCEPCKMMVPVLEQAARDYAGKANIVSVELQEYGELGREYRIVTMPTLIFFNEKGEEVSRHMGYMGTEDIERELATLGVKK
jgi:thioredoxin 1